METRTGLEKLAEYPFHLATWVDGDGYPITAVVNATVDWEAGAASFAMPAGLDVPLDREVSLTGSHIRPQPGIGYDERRHVTVWGRVTGRGPEAILRAERAWGWNEQETPFFEYSERNVGQSKRYFGRVSAEQGRDVRPRLSLGWLTLRATRLPFLTATFVPVLLGIAIAIRQGFFEPVSALLTVVGAAFVHLALNVANDVFDTRSGADDANVNPTKYSGGSRVIQYGLVSLRRMAELSTAFYLIGGAIGLLLLALRGSPALLAIGVIGLILSLEYTAPPLKLVYRGLGEVTTALGFGPLMLVGAYVVQTAGIITLEPFVASIPVAILVALILYVNEIPDRRGDAMAGKRTLPVRLPQSTVVRIYLVAAIAAFASVVLGVGTGVLPIPTLAVLLAVPLARQVYAGIQRYYDQPYGLMAIMGVNVKLHLVVGGLLLVAYVAVIAIAFALPQTSLYLR
jgi:1,4-dihydroxy-2-naphthoate octaprenyltransferase